MTEAPPPVSLWDLPGFKEDDLTTIQVPPLNPDERAHFLLRRFCEYRDSLFREVGVVHESTPKEPLSPKQIALKARMSDLADRLAYDDLQALLGRRGRSGLRVEMALRASEGFP